MNETEFETTRAAVLLMCADFAYNSKQEQRELLAQYFKIISHLSASGLSSEFIEASVDGRMFLTREASVGR